MGQLTATWKPGDSLAVQFICWLWVLSAFILPPVVISASLPAFEPVLFLLPLMFVISLPRFRNVWNASWKYILAVALCGLMLMLSMLVNGRLFNLRDDFELFKLGKYLIVFFFVASFFAQRDYMPYLRVTLVLLLVFNVLHYFDLFGFHYAVEKYYGSDAQVLTFGFNSLGQPDSKRLLGTMGNPNYNALLFGFFMVMFFPRRNQQLTDKILFALSVLAFVFCQSRTAYIAMLPLLGMGFWLFRSEWKTIAFTLAVFAAAYGLNLLAGNIYVNSLGNQAWLMKSKSVMGRIETWKHLWKMTLEKPVFGYGPWKEYFYEREIYAESEYVQSLWRMGFAGFPFFLLMLFWPLAECRRMLQSDEARQLVLFLILFLICCFTNNPFSNTSTILYLAIVTGLFYGKMPAAK